MAISFKDYRGSAIDQGAAFLGVIFIVAKVFGVEPVASWSWWWVTVPFWGPITFIAVAMFIILFLSEFAKQLGKKFKIR